MVLGLSAQVLEDALLPESLHQIPVLHHSMTDGVLAGIAHLVGLVSNVEVYIREEKCVCVCVCGGGGGGGVEERKLGKELVLHNKGSEVGPVRHGLSIRRLEKRRRKAMQGNQRFESPP